MSRCYLLLMHDSEKGGTELGIFSEEHPTLPLRVVTGVVMTTEGVDYATAHEKMEQMIESGYPSPAWKAMLDRQEAKRKRQLRLQRLRDAVKRQEAKLAEALADLAEEEGTPRD